MLKKISIEHLILGMYVHAFCGSWMEHPFWKTKFVLKDPVGSLVRMGSGKIGVVVEQGQQSLTSPKVRLFFSTKSGLRIAPILVDLSDRHCIEKIVSREDPDKWHFPDLNELWSGIAEIAH